MSENDEITAKEYVRWARESLNIRDKKRRMSSCWSDLKNAINTQADLVLIRNNHKREADTWDLPSKLRKLNELGFTIHKSFQKVIENRNNVVHRNRVPQDDPEPYIALAELFISDTNRKLKEDIEKNRLDDEELLERYEVLLNKQNMSVNTVMSYLYAVKEFLKFVKKSPKNVKLHDVEGYLLTLIKKQRFATATISKTSLTYFFNKILLKNFNVEIKIPASAKRPPALQKRDIKTLLELVKNQRLRLMIGLIYGSGLRLGNVANLRKGDIDFTKKVNSIKRTGNVSQSEKQQFIMSELIRRELMDYAQDKEGYLFHTKQSNNPTRHLQKVIEEAARRIGVHANPNILRKSFGAHLRENGYNDVIILTLLGKTKYIKDNGLNPPTKQELENVRSPLDDILMGKQIF